MKVCSKCKIEKELNEFSKDKYHKTGYTVQCKECRNKKKIEYRKTNEGAIKTKNYRILRRLQPEIKEREKIRNKQRRLENKRTEYSKIWFNKNKNHIYELRRQREEEYFRIGKKVYFGKLVGKIKNVVFKKGCFVELENGMRMWLAKYKLKPYKYILNLSSNK